MVIAGASLIQVFCVAEAHLYAEYFGIPVDEFFWVTYCAQPEEISDTTSPGAFIFCGGLHDRDWETFYRAVRNLPVKVRVAAPKEQIPSRFIAPNMTLLGTVSREQYFEPIAGSMLLVLALTPIVRFHPGVITYVYAMLMGKCVVVNDPMGATSYIENDVTGVIVSNGDTEGLEIAIRLLLTDDSKRQLIGHNAQLYAQEHFSPEAHWNRVSDAVRNLIGRYVPIFVSPKAACSQGPRNPSCRCPLLYAPVCPASWIQ